MDSETSAVQPNFAMGGERQKRKKEILLHMMTLLYAWLGDEEKSMTTAAAHLKAQMGPLDYSGALILAGATSHLAEAVRLFDECDLTKGSYYAKIA